MSFHDAQQRVDAWISQYEEGYFHPLTNICRVTGRGGLPMLQALFASA